MKSTLRSMPMTVRSRGSARAALGLAILLAAAAGCAAPSPDRPAEPPRAEARAEARAAVERLEEAERLLASDRPDEAASLADSLYAAFREDTGLRALANRALWVEARAHEVSGRLGAAGEALETLLERLERGGVRREAVTMLAGIRDATGDEEGAVRVLLENPEVVGDPERALLRESVARLRLGTLSELAERHSVEDAGGEVLHAGLARELVLEGRHEEARDVAARVLDVAPEGPERRLASLIVEAEGALAGPIRVGAVLPLTGRFAEVGGLLREGIELAVDAFTEGPGRGLPVELVVRDDASDPERTPDLVTSLEEEGVVAILGPLRSESLAAAARARSNPRLPLVSPTATDVLGAAEGVYSLWDRSRRERDVAAAVGSYTARRLGARTGAVLHPDTPAGRWAAAGFGEGLREGGAELVTAVPYPSEATTFEAAVTSASEAEVDVVYVSAESGSQLLQIAPQLNYYRLLRPLIAGGAVWAEPSVLRRLDGTAADFRIVGTTVDRSPGGAWERFKNLYEETYRKPLPDNMLAALAHDAATLVLAGLREAALPLPGAVTAALAEGVTVEGATGTLRPDPETSTVGRETHVRMIRGGELVEVDSALLFEWQEGRRARADSLDAAEEREAEEGREAGGAAPTLQLPDARP